ncbi:MAG: GNAT family N-acetyltransferase [Thermomicrobiales bacterium]|nr:GNAT family N-acetyltransferase [Thermomicrobiales bacterium]
MVASEPRAEPAQAEAPAPRPVIGPVRWAELPAVARLQARAFRRGLAYRLPTLLLLRASPGVRFLVAREQGRVIGCAIGDRAGTIGRVVNLAVDPDVRRRGVGTALLAAVEAALPGGDMLLMVEAHNTAARALYEHAGYLPSGQAPNYYGRGHHGIWMRKPRPQGG